MKMTHARSIVFAAVLGLPVAGWVTSQKSLDVVKSNVHLGHTDSVLLAKVREATEPFRDVRNAPPGYGPALGCVSGPDAGAMGVHFINGDLVGDAVVEAEHPEALIYEFKNGGARLVGVEYIVLSELWHAKHALNDPPVLEGQLLHFTDTPNRFGLPAFYELHAWAWQDNPNGAFVDWNTKVSCEGQ